MINNIVSAMFYMAALTLIHTAHYNNLGLTVLAAFIAFMLALSLFIAFENIAVKILEYEIVEILINGKLKVHDTKPKSLPLLGIKILNRSYMLLSANSFMEVFTLLFIKTLMSGYLAVYMTSWAAGIKSANVIYMLMLISCCIYALIDIRAFKLKIVKVIYNTTIIRSIVFSRDTITKLIQIDKYMTYTV